MPHSDPAGPLDRVEEALATLWAGRERARWSRLTGSAGGDAAEVAGPGQNQEPEDPSALDAREAAIWGDAEYQAALQAATAAGATGERLARAVSPAERRLDLHRRALLESLVRLDPGVAGRAAGVERQLEEFRVALEAPPATRVTRRERLRHEPERDAREAWWFGLAPLAEALEPELVRLFDARNTLAGAFGYTMYPELAFEAGELSRIEFMSTCDEIEQLTRPIYEQFLAWCREQLDGLPLEPWDLDFLLTRLEPADADATVADIPARVAARMAAWGATLAPTVLVEAAMNPATLALAWGAGPGVLLGGGTGPDGLEAALRAAGQAWYRRQLPAAPPAWRWEAPVMEQAMGHLAVRLSRPAGEESPEDERARAWRGWRDVARLRRRISDGLFEMLAYEQPHTDLHGLYSEIQEHYLGYSRHPERLWPAVPSLAARPGHLAALITGLLAADQIAESLRQRHGGTLASPAIAAELCQAFAAPGARIPWETRLADFTGRPLDAGATLRRLGADPDS